jgi:predicted AlkP superfamily phosphohydrolase/phosphomutase
MDQIQHLYWNLLDEESGGYGDSREAREMRAVMERIFRRLDAFVAARYEDLGDDDILLIISDHGFGNWRRRFLVNRWLAKHGWLRYQMRRVWGDRIRHALGLPLTEVERGEADLIGGTLADRSARYIDWERTVAYASHPSEQAIYLNLQGRDPQGRLPAANYERVRSEIVAALNQARDPRSGEPLVRAAYPREELLHGPHTPCAPDIYLDLGDLPVTPSPNITPHPAVVRDISGPEGGHRPDGLIIAAGARVARGAPLAADAQDIAPTLLHLLDQPVPGHMDGRVLTELLRPEELEARPVRLVAGVAAETRGDQVSMTQQEEADLAESLRSLGYL